MNVTTLACPARDPKDLEHNHHIIETNRVRHCLFCGLAESAIWALARMSEVGASLPEGLCGIERQASIRTLIDAEDVLVTTGKCVFLALHEGEHSWEQ